MVGRLLLLAALSARPACALDPLFVASENRELVDELTTRYLPGTQPGVAAAWVHQESRWKATAVSKKGARGPLQIMPETARDIRWACKMPELDLTNMESSLKGGFCYARNIRRLLQKQLGPMASQKDLDELMFRAYNGGGGYLIKEKEAAKKEGKDDTVAASLKEHCRDFRSKDSCEENTSYFPYIMQWYKKYYHSW
jgi:membrane-bound lytic murein transglycosylase MltF